MIGYMNGLALDDPGEPARRNCSDSRWSADDLIDEFTGFFRGLAHGDAVPAAAAVGIAGIVAHPRAGHWLPKVPAVLVMVVASIAATTGFDLAAHGVSLVGTLPKGFRR